MTMQIDGPLKIYFKMKTIVSISATCLFICLFNCPDLLGQGTVSGSIKDANGPLPFANVLLLLPADSTLVHGAVTNDDGTFVIENIN